jgi:UDP-glucose 4-epimerase
MKDTHAPWSDSQDVTAEILTYVRVLVTGATGFLGHAVVSALAERRHVVTALSRHSLDIPARADSHVSADVRSADSLVDAVAEVDAVCHLAALARVRDSFAKPLDYWRTNVTGTMNVLDALSRTGTPKRVVLSSTGAIYGAPKSQPISEDQPPAPGNPYAATKLAADLAALNVAETGAIGAVSLRAFNIAGASGGHADPDETRLIPKVIAVQTGHAPELVINGDGSAVRDYVHVDDMADAFVRALDACAIGSWRAYNIGSGRRTSIRDVVRAAETVTGRPVPIRHAPAANEPPTLLADSTRAETELGWHPIRSDLTTIVEDAWKAVRT